MGLPKSPSDNVLWGVIRGTIIIHVSQKKKFLKKKRKLICTLISIRRKTSLKAFPNMLLCEKLEVFGKNVKERRGRLLQLQLIVETTTDNI